jgi:hypothetical protein
LVAAIVFAKAWHKSGIECKHPKEQDTAEVYLIALLDRPIRWCECHFPAEHEPEAEGYSEIDHPVGQVRVCCYAADNDDSVTIVLPIEVVL